MSFIKQTSVYLNGVKVGRVMEADYGNNHIEEIFTTIEDQNDIYVLVQERHQGTFRAKAHEDATTQPVLLLSQVLAEAVGHAEYDTSTSKVGMVSEDYGLNAEYATIGYSPARRLIELRQVHRDTEVQLSDSGGANEKALAIGFRAPAEAIYKIGLMLKDGGGDVTSFEMEIWDDSAGLPNAKVTNSNTITVYAGAGVNTATDYYLGAALTGTQTWYEMDQIDGTDTTNINGTATLTVNALYHLVIRGVNPEDGTVLYVGGTTHALRRRGALVLDDDVDNSPAWDGSLSTMNDATFIIQGRTTQGHTLTFVHTTDGGADVTVTFSQVKFLDRNNVEVSPQTAAETPLSWEAYEMTIT